MRQFPYRAVRTEILPQAPLSEDDPLVQLERQALIEAGARLAELARAASPAALPPESPAVPAPPAEELTRAFFWQHGLHRLRGTVQYPGVPHMPRSDISSVSRVREIRTHGLKGGSTPHRVLHGVT
ncbi:MAG: hypothetical protein E6K81_05370 [Candidatus Eisenbacteria bacterium]|uniref:Uncharacterized protein n=1 Tax=Eiseniibacteriota bacterium TaxID=2212470 RepID=A0A538UBH7_UNCEI|nr:MAG: hypothetical protein E6K81_05370 [Candidatus Eisenbacteria bacterium]